MKRGMILLLAALSMATLMVVGCTNNEVVKQETPLPQTIKPVEPAQTITTPTITTPTVTETSKPIVAATNQQPETATSTETISAEHNALETIYFDFDKSDLSPAAREALTKNAAMLQNSMKNASIRIEGNCDERGSAEYNLALGERRAKSALQYLLTLGVKSNRLSVISYGKEKPAVQGNDEAAWAKNRRDEFVTVK